MSTKDFLEKDYYKALGVAKTAKPAEIKAAYRKLARKYHPDANKGDSSAEERFKEISEAYDVLSDDTKRREYDEALARYRTAYELLSDHVNDDSDRCEDRQNRHFRASIGKVA